MAGRRSQRGFTLIEILAVVAILALVAAFVVPNLGGFRMRALRSEAARLASHLELARQRAIMTGVPHRVWLELEQSEYRLEWLAQDPETADLESTEPDELDLNGNTPLDLAAPPAPVLDYQPIPGNFGKLQVVSEPFYFEAVETPEGRIERGEVSIGFARDGTADYPEIYLQDAQGDQIALDVQPLDDRVRIRRDDDL
jgi:prepilin-type N-terminal cleavage/methylation domain-containing protein